MFRFFGLFLVSILSISAAAQSKISGKVTYGSNLPLHDASVSIVETRQSTMSNDDGYYEFSNVPAGRFTVSVHLHGFADVSKSVTVEPNGGDLTLNFQMQISQFNEDVTVTASGTEQSIFDSLQSVNSVASTTIIERASTSIGDVLDGESGVAKRSFGPGSSRPVIRGFDGDRVLVLQDGVRTGSVGSQSGDHGEPIDPMSAERIEVVKGPGTLLFGSNALGGVVNVISSDENEAHEGLRGFASLVGGSAESQAGFAGGLELGFKKFLLRGNLGAQRSDDFASPVGRIPNSSARSNTGSGYAGYFDTKFYLNAGYAGDLRRYGIPFAALFEGGGVEERGSGLPTVDDEIDIRIRNHKARVNGGVRNLTNQIFSGMQFSLDFSKYRHKEIETVDDLDEVGTVFDNRTLSYRTLFEQKKYSRLTGRFGFEGFERNYEINGAEQLISGEIGHRSFAVYGLEELDFDRLKFQFGARIEHNSYQPENAELRPRSFTGISAGAGFNIRLWKGGLFVANFSHTNRAPALEELYNRGPHIGNLTFEIGNNDLAKESANGIELSVRHQTSRLRFSTNFYHYQIRDYVFLSPVDDDDDGEPDFEDGLKVGNYSQADASYTGAEVAAEVAINKYFGAFVNFDYVRAKLDDLSIDLPRIPPARARIGLNFQHNEISIRPEFVIAADQDRLFPLETRTPGYGLFNVAATYVIARQHYAHVFSVNAYNLTDKLYSNHVSFIKDLVPEVGRGVRVGYTIRFF